MRKSLFFYALASLFDAPLDAGLPRPLTKLTAAEIVEKNACACGGSAAWRAVETLIHVRKNGRRGEAAVAVPLLFELTRPRRVRSELGFRRDTAFQVFDGTNGWKLRPFLNRRDVERYTPEEVKAAALQSDLDGSLMDYVSGLRMS